MISDEAFVREMLQNAEPDCWDKRWRQVRGYGAGMAVELEVGEFLHAFVRMMKPEFVIETGTHKGFSALMIAQALRSNGRGHLHTIDVKDYGIQAHVDRFGLSEWVTFIQEDSAKAIRRIANDRKVDFLWLDAHHSKNSVLGEVDAALPSLKKGSYVAFHDTKTSPGEAEAVREVRKRYPAWEHMGFQTARGFALMRVA